MQSVLRVTCLGVALAGVLAGSSRGADFKMDIKSDGIQLGSHVMGPTLTAGDLQGKVVFLEFWGIN